MAIPSVTQGTIELEDGKVFELDSPRGKTWLESIGSFRFEPSGANKPYTVRKESGKGGDYWYGYRKQNRKLHKKYIGKSSEVNTAKLEEIAEALNTPPQPRVTDKVTNKVTEGVELVAQAVVSTVADDRLTTLESQVASLQKALEALQEALPGKSEAGNVEELPTVTDSELQIELGNLRGENEKLQKEVQELRSQLEVKKTRSEGAWEEMEDSEKTLAAVRSELAELKQKSVTAGKEFPEAADILNQLKKAKGKKFTASLADVESILEILEES